MHVCVCVYVYVRRLCGLEQSLQPLRLCLAPATPQLLPTLGSPRSHEAAHSCSTNIHFHPFQVRYLREVTPYFRKSLTTPTSSPVMLASGNGSGSGGDLSHGMGVSAAGMSSTGGGGSGLPQTGLWPLRLCYLCRNLTVVDPSERCFEVHSPDGRRSCVLRCQDRERAVAWFTSVSQQIAVLNQTCLQELNRLLPANQELKYLGWLCEQVGTLIIPY